MERFRFWCVAVSAALGTVISVVMWAGLVNGALAGWSRLGCPSERSVLLPFGIACSTLATLATHGWTTLKPGRNPAPVWLYAGYWLIFAAIVTIYLTAPCVEGNIVN